MQDNASYRSYSTCGIPETVLWFVQGTVYGLTGRKQVELVGKGDQASTLRKLFWVWDARACHW